MTARYFVDSNVLVYARDLTERGKQKRAELWIETLWIAGAGRLSYQVMIEAYAALTRPGMPRMGTSAARTYISNFRRWHPVMADGLLIQGAWQVQDRFKFSWWDCLIVAAAQLTQCNYLLTEDLQHAQDLDGLVVINPFETEPEAVQG
jgi:predicted nucleic acid-binding protein